MSSRTREQQQAYYIANKEKIKARSRANYYANHKKRLGARKKYRDAHREELVAKQRKYREQHLEERREYDLQYAARHREEARARAKAYRETYPEKNRAAIKRWETANRGRVRELRRITEFRRRLGRNADAITYAEILKKDPCSYCGERATSVDHIVPVVASGPNEWTNLTSSCRSCNSTKSDRPLLYFLLVR
jgi:5-methylcytosine-specific restriction endonuclease McrA